MQHHADEDLTRLAEIDHELTRLARERIRCIAAAQRHGASWEAIATALGTTKQSAWETYRRRVGELLDATAASAVAGEDELVDAASASLARVRGRRRR